MNEQLTGLLLEVGGELHPKLFIRHSDGVLITASVNKLTARAAGMFLYKLVALYWENGALRIRLLEGSSNETN